MQQTSSSDELKGVFPFEMPQTIIVTSRSILDLSQCSGSIAMASPPSMLEEVCAAAGVDPVLSNALVQEGWTTESFGVIASDLVVFEQALPELFPNDTLSLLQKSQIKAAFKRCQQLGDPSVQPSQDPDPRTPAHRILGPKALRRSWIIRSFMP